jgi:hypothetical protein
MAPVASLARRRRLIASRRHALEQWIERAIALLDGIDGDADLEPDCEGDPLDAGECDTADYEPICGPVCLPGSGSSDGSSVVLKAAAVPAPQEGARKPSDASLSLNLSRSRHPAACPINGSATL